MPHVIQCPLPLPEVYAYARLTPYIITGQTNAFFMLKVLRDMSFYGVMRDARC